MSKIEIAPLPSGHAATAALNNRLQLIEDALNNDVLYRDNPEGEPNSMNNTLDMDDNQIINLPDATLDHEPVPFGQFSDIVEEIVNEELTEQMLLVGTGNVVGPISAVDGELALFDGLTGKLLKRGVLYSVISGRITALEAVIDQRQTTVDTIAALATTTPSYSGQTFLVTEYIVGSGIGGGDFVAVSGSTTANNITTFNGPTGWYFKRVNYDKIYSSFAGINGTAGDYAKVLALVALQKSVGLKLSFNAGNHVIAGRVTWDFDNAEVEWTNNSYFTQTADEIAILLFKTGATINNIILKNPKIVTAGYGADSDGLIQVTTVTNSIIENPIIESNRTAALARTRVYNGINVAISENIRILGGRISGTPKSGIHISTASRNAKAYDVTISDTGNHATGTYGFSPGGDCGGYGGNGFIRCRAYDTQGEAFLIMAENNVTYGDQLCYGNLIESCSGENNGKSAIRQGTFTSGVYPRDTKIIDNAFNIAGEYGLQISAGTGYSRNNKFKNTQLAGLYLTSDLEFIQWESTDDDVENFDLVNSASWNGILVGTVSSAIITSPKITHDFVGVTASNIFGVGTVSGKTQTLMRVLDPHFNGVTQPWRLQSAPTAGHFRYSGAGAPGGSNIPNSSIYFRNDGGGATDNLYKRVAGAWTGYA